MSAHKMASIAILAAMGGGLAAGCVSDRSTGNETLTATTCSAPSSAAGATVVFIRSFTFDPNAIHIKAGGSVAWVNCEPTNIPHTATDDAGSYDSGSLSPGAAYVKSFATPGTFDYHCAIHPGMKASVVVE